MSNNEPIFDSVLSGLRQLEPQERRRAFGIIKKEREAELDEARENAPLLPNNHFDQEQAHTAPQPLARPMSRSTFQNSPCWGL